MKTRHDAERVIELSEQREQLHWTTKAIQKAETIGACDTVNNSYSGRGPCVAFAHLTSELRDLIKREAELQIAAFDDELKGLGVVPDELVVE